MQKKVNTYLNLDTGVTIIDFHKISIVNVNANARKQASL